MILFISLFAEISRTLCSFLGHPVHRLHSLIVARPPRLHWSRSNRFYLVFTTHTKLSQFCLSVRPSVRLSQSLKVIKTTRNIDDLLLLLQTHGPCEPFWGQWSLSTSVVRSLVGPLAGCSVHINLPYRPTSALPVLHWVCCRPPSPTTRSWSICCYLSKSLSFLCFVKPTTAQCLLYSMILASK